MTEVNSVTLYLPVFIHAPNIILKPDSDDDMVVVLQDYPSAEISEPIYRMGQKLRVTAL